MSTNAIPPTATPPATADNAYMPRIIDTAVDEYLATFPALSVEGPKWCGKTTTCRRHARSQTSLADPAGGFRNRRIAQMEPNLLLGGDEPRLIDEWQEAPGIWDAVRYACDQDTRAGRFLLTGSATPRASQRPMHSGAGRIGRLEMSSMTMAETGESSGDVSLSGLFGGATYTALSEATLEKLALCIVRGGWPAAVGLGEGRARLVARDYLTAVAEDDISQVDGARRDPDRARRILASLGRNEATLAGKTAVLRDIATYDAEGDGGVDIGTRLKRAAPLAETTYNEYLGALERMHVVQDIPAWHPALRSPVRIRQARKHHLADPSLAAAAIGASVASLLDDLKTFGFLFESLAAHDLIVYARAMGGTVMHYRDDSNLEVDLIVERPDGAWGAFEVKLGATQVDDGAANVLRLEAKMTERGQRPPAVKAVIVGVGDFAHRRDDGVQVIPLDTLGR